MMESFSSFLLQNYLAFRSFMSPNRVLPLLISVILSACCFRVWWNLPPNHQYLIPVIVELFNLILAKHHVLSFRPKCQESRCPETPRKRRLLAGLLALQLNVLLLDTAPGGVGLRDTWPFPTRLRNLLGDMTFTGSRTLSAAKGSRKAYNFLNSQNCF